MNLVAGMGFTERTKLCDRFTDPADTAQVLICNFRSASLGLNLQTCCHRVVMMDMPDNVNTVLQSIGRVHRLGQAHEQEIYILGEDQSYDQVLQAKACRKMICQLCGEASLDMLEFSAAEKEEFRARLKAKALEEWKAKEVSVQT